MSINISGHVILLFHIIAYYSMVKILAIVVTYYPDEIMLRNNISAFINHVDKVLIWENTPIDKEQYRFVKGDKIEYCGDGINSISRALNYAWKYGVEHSFDYLLTMDQDSRWESFDMFLSQTVYNHDAPIGIWSPSINSVSSIFDFKEIDKAITSGSLVSIELLNNIQGWNELFPVDALDTEFCCHAKRIGIKTYEITNCRLNQRLGEPQYVTFLGHKHILRNDSPSRLYNIILGFYLMKRKYKEVPSAQTDFLNWLKRSVWILLFENRKWSKFLAISRGIVNGFRFDINQLR